MVYEVVKTYVVYADSVDKANKILEKFEAKNVQSLLLKSVVTTVADPESRTGIWPKLW